MQCVMQSKSNSSSPHDYANRAEEEEEEEWIESYGWNNDKKEEDGLFGDMFSDPDPYETFHFTFEPRRDVSDGATKRTNASVIKIDVQGCKAENGQTLNSTGLTLWRASNILCEFLLSCSRQIIQHKSVLELGAGLGICGILAHKLGASCVVLTDGDTTTLKALRQNIALNCDGSSTSPTISCKQLRWGRQLREFASSICVPKFQVILGSDVVYAKDQIEPLFTTVLALLDPNGTFLLAFTRRNVSIDCVLACATSFGFSWIAPDSSEGVFQFHPKDAMVS